MNSFVFDRIRGQERALGLLRESLATERIAQAYLFHGPAGVGKTTAALALAAALNCEEAPAARPCGRCLPCRKTAGFNHPDVHFLMPLFPADLWKEEAGKGSAEEPGQSPFCQLLAEWVTNPSHVFSWPKPPSIATEWILEIRLDSARQTFEGRTKVIVISGVETMSVEAANRILKMLEEPGPHTVFILTTSRLHQVLPTIRSRCQRISFGEIDRAHIVAILSEQGVDPAQVEQLASLARGSVGRALQLADEGVLDVREWALGLVSLDPAGLRARLSADVLGAPARWDARRVTHVAEVLMTWYRDTLTVMHELPEERLAHRDRAEQLAEDAGRLDPIEVGRRIRLLEELIQTVESNVTPALALFSTLSELGRSAVALR
jgi:DNA polymerase-3 subunit delta'